MITFEEFFLKKKIDLETFQASKPDLFMEFKAHFAQMNEKSFDHTKKYWFNDLRREFHLSEEKEVILKEALKPKETPPISAVVEETIKESTTVVKPAGFKPRFNAPVAERIKEHVPVEKESEEVQKPAGFKPRFKARVTPHQKEKEPEAEGKKEVAELPKPLGFKPRFKAGVTGKPEEVKKEEETEEEKPIVSKPAGFKPRFKAGQTAAKPKDENE